MVSEGRRSVGSSAALSWVACRGEVSGRTGFQVFVMTAGGAGTSYLLGPAQSRWQWFFCLPWLTQFVALTHGFPA
jgi:hypothetical protein